MDNNIESLIQQNELTIEEAKEKVKRWQALERLQKNKDWKYLIEDELMNKAIVRLTLLKASPNLKGVKAGTPQADQVALILEGIDCRLDMIGEFATFIRLTKIEGEGAKEALVEHELTREQLLAEQLEEDDV